MLSGCCPSSAVATIDTLILPSRSAEVIIGAITSEDLDGKIRVSIVATALDGQQPESKSVINMVHRIQNRNPGYSDFNTTSSAQSFNFSPTTNSPISHGANALKLENEVVTETTSSSVSSDIINNLNNEYNEALLSNQETEMECIVENNQSNDYEQSFEEESINDQGVSEATNSTEIEDITSNGLENFAVEEETAPDLFSSDNEIKNNEDLLSKDTNENDSEDDDLEIPAFLRRQKH